MKIRAKIKLKRCHYKPFNNFPWHKFRQTSRATDKSPDSHNLFQFPRQQGGDLGKFRPVKTMRGLGRDGEVELVNNVFIPVYQLLVYPVGVQLIGTLRSDDGNDNENLIEVTGACASHFLYLSLPFLHNYDVQIPDFNFYRGRKQATTKFSLLYLPSPSSHLIGTLRSDNGEVHENVVNFASFHYFARLFQGAQLLKRREFSLELKRMDRAQVLTEMVEFIALTFPFPS